MRTRPLDPADASAVEALFLSVFTRSEGADEAAIVARLARDLMATTPAEDLAGFVAVDGEDDTLVGAILFSRLRFADDVEAFILSPVAVHADRQGEGIGRRLIADGLDVMRDRGVELVMTYGDPAFYARTGFAPVDPAVVPPPLPLSQPEGWIGQSLRGDAIRPLAGPCTCVAALDDPALW